MANVASAGIARSMVTRFISSENVTFSITARPKRFDHRFVEKDDSVPREILLLDSAREVKFLRRAVALNDKSGMVHVRDQAERLAFRLDAHN